MAKKIFIFLLFFVNFQGCNRSSPVSLPEEDNYPPPDPATQNVVNIRMGDPYGDSIKPCVSTDTLNDSNAAEIGFKIFIENTEIDSNGGLRKVALDRASVRDRRVTSIGAATLSFVSLDSKDTVNANYPVVNGVCAVTSVKVPLGHTYQVLVSLWWIPKCPWSTYYIYDRAFSAVDTVDVRTKNKDTLNLIFYESITIKYFLTLKVPAGSPWTEGRNYATIRSVPVLYKNNTLCSYYIMNDLRSRETCTMELSCDTGTVLLSFIPNVMGVLAADGTVKVSQDSVFFGVHETHEDSIRWVPITDPPEHVRYQLRKIFLGKISSCQDVKIE